MRADTILPFASAFLSAAVGVIVGWKEPRSVARWSFVAGMAALAIEATFAGMTAQARLPERMDRWQSLQLMTMSLLPGLWILFSLCYARGNYQEFLRRWRFRLAAAFVLPVGLAIGFRRELVLPVRPAGGGEEWVLGWGAAGLLLHLMLLAGAVLVLTNLERTFRAAVGTMRWRIKYTILGLGVLFAIRAYTSSQLLLFRPVDISLQAVNSGALVIACLLIARSLLRAGHFTLDIYPSHFVLRNSLTALLAGIYLFTVGIFAKIITALGGDAAFTTREFFVLVALVLLTMLLLDERVRLHLTRFISRHFRRPMHDYRAVWRTFTQSTVSQVRQAELCRAVARSVSELFQVMAVTVWVVDERKEGLRAVASTSLSAGKREELSPQKSEVAEVLEALRAHPEPLDLDAAKEAWAEALRRCHPVEFPKGGSRVCVPLIAGGEVLGLMTIGDRVGGARFSVEDFDLLKCAADQAAASLLNLELLERLMQAKELEAFQTMSAFFVHDLKNTASTLSLMLQNLPVHFDNPEFREDALKGVSKTVAHINGLVSRLSLLREKMEIRAVETDLSEVVTGAIQCLDGAPGVAVVRDLRALPKLRLDPDQIQKVVTNLALNAREALGQGGTIRVATERQNSWAVLSVSDDGCGMSSEYVGRRLFRPFQTTKQQGTGIGLFQCKVIVEAHRGRIEVETELGKGTTVRVLLPLAA
jgi:putative PEP-CTERM system histidine kinase